jgi:hypothetical protein
MNVTKASLVCIAIMLGIITFLMLNGELQKRWQLDREQKLMNETYKEQAEDYRKRSEKLKQDTDRIIKEETERAMNNIGTQPAQ